MTVPAVIVYPPHVITKTTRERRVQRNEIKTDSEQMKTTYEQRERTGTGKNKGRRLREDAKTGFLRESQMSPYSPYEAATNKTRPRIVLGGCGSN